LPSTLTPGDAFAIAAIGDLEHFTKPTLRLNDFTDGLTIIQITIGVLTITDTVLISITYTHITITLAKIVDGDSGYACPTFVVISDTITSTYG